jgi:peptide/nickel transport system substrate-binding protein
MKQIRKFLASVALVFALALPATAQQPAATKDTLSVDLPGDAATLDPHVQWDTDSYTIYRNIFDNLLTRDAAGKIVPQIGAAWRYVSDTVIDFDIRTDVKFHDGSALTPEDVVFSVKRITNPAFKSPQLGQFNSIVAAEVIGPATVRLTTKEPYPALLAQLVKLSIVPKRHVESVGDVKFNLEPIGSGPYRLAS